MNPLRRCLEVDDLDAEQLETLLTRAETWKRDPTAVPAALAGRGAALLFEKPSARTRVSTEMAVWTLGGHPVTLRGEEVGLGTRETPEDLARTLACFCAVVAARVNDHAALEAMAAAISDTDIGVPVLNLLSDRAHPCQAFADLLTLRELLGSVVGRRLAFVGDGNNVAASLAFAAALSGLELIVSSPAGYELDDETVDRARNLGGTVELITDPYEAVSGADAVYTDVWTSMGQEAEAEQRRAAFAGYRVDQALLEHAGPDSVLLHCLPAHRGDEVTSEVLDGPRSAIWRQAANRMHSVRALLSMLVEHSPGPGGQS